LVAALGAVLAAGLPTEAAVASPKLPVRCRELNHVTLRVKDLARSRQFYARVLVFRASIIGALECKGSLAPVRLRMIDHASRGATRSKGKVCRSGKTVRIRRSTSSIPTVSLCN
jgi:hypothetical protein